MYVCSAVYIYYVYILCIFQKNMLFIYYKYKLYEYKYRHVNACTYFQNIYCVCVFIYTYANESLFCMRLIIWQHYKALNNTDRVKAALQCQQVNGLSIMHEDNNRVISPIKSVHYDPFITDTAVECSHRWTGTLSILLVFFRASRKSSLKSQVIETVTFSSACKP